MMSMDYITDVVNRLINKYDTRDPVELCRCLGVRVRYKDLEKSVKAYFCCFARIKSIVIDNRLSDFVKNVFLAHELGHAVLHKDVSMSKGFQELEIFDNTSAEEYEANLFAAELLIDDDELLEIINEDNSFFGAARQLGVPAEMLDFKFRVMKRKGYRLEAPFYSDSKFLKNEIEGMYDEWSEC